MRALGWFLCVFSLTLSVLWTVVAVVWFVHGKPVDAMIAGTVSFLSLASGVSVFGQLLRDKGR